MSGLPLFLLYVLTVILPTLFWLWFFRWLDRYEPEPRRLVAKTFLWGILTSILVLGASIGILIAVFSAGSLALFAFDGIEAEGTVFVLVIALAFLAGPVEEGAKFLVLRHAVTGKPAFNQIADGIVYGAVIALGFSFVENTLYFVNINEAGDTGVLAYAAVLRAVASTLLHITATGIAGYALGIAKFTGRSRRFVFGVVALAALYHGVYNVALSVHPLGPIVSFSLVFVVFLYTVRLLRDPRSRILWRRVREGEENGNTPGSS